MIILFSLYAIATYFGYLASLMLIISLVVNNEIKFRWYNAAGTIAFIVYGVLLDAIPVLLTNAILLVINIYYLYKIYKRKENFDLIVFTGNEMLANKFIAYYRKDIQAYFPDFKEEDLTNNLNFVVLRDLVIANMFSAHIDEAGTATVALNYTLPRYRDFKVGRYIFEKEKHLLLSKGIQRIEYKGLQHPGHRKFLEVMGFEAQKLGNALSFQKTLSAP